MRGQRDLHAAAMFCAGRPLYIRDSVDSDEQRDAWQRVLVMIKLPIRDELALGY